MKYVLCAILLVIAVFACGCTATGSPPAAMESKPAMVVTSPNLLGTWSGQMNGYIERTGYMNYPNYTVKLVVSEQNGRLFNGSMIYSLDNRTVKTEGIAGEIARDGRTLHMVEFQSGYDFGTILSPDELELVYVSDLDPSIIAIDTLKRQ